MERSPAILGRARVCAAALALTAAAAALLSSALAPAAHAGRKAADRAPATSKKLPGFKLGVDDSGFASAAGAPLALARSKEIGATYARGMVNWDRVAPPGRVKPPGFDPRNPADPRYRWSDLDAEVRRLVAGGMTVYLTVLGAPKWAQQGTPPAGSGAGGGAWRPSPAEFGAFAHAAAVRYGGAFPDPLTGAPLPRVRFWQAWNEPNLPVFLAPASPEVYRDLLNSFYGEIKTVQPDATVVSAGLAPVKSSDAAAFPKEFAMQLLCLRPDSGWFAKDRGCRAPARFDVFSVHPYSLRAKPRQRAAIDGNMFVADVVDVSQMLRAATRLRSVRPAAAKALWSTEFAWFTNPPNASVGDPPDAAAERTLVALHALWKAGVSHVTWFSVSDNSAAIVKGGGFYYADDRPKPTRDALRFPFYVSQSGRSGYVWGRAPLRATKRVFIQQLGKHGFRTVLKLRPRTDGLFSVRFRLRGTKPGSFRARQSGRVSLPLPSSGAGG